jgi:hypothetical protein
VNLARDSRISLTIDHDVSDPMAVLGLSMTAHAQPVADPTEVAKAMKLLQTRYPSRSALRRLPLLLQLGPDLEQTGGMLLVVCDCVDDGTAQHLKGIIFGIVDLQDPKGFSDIVAD